MIPPSSGFFIWPSRQVAQVTTLCGCYNRSMTLEEKRKYRREAKRKQDARYKLLAYEILGNKCIQCEIVDTRVFTIDHIDPVLRHHKNEHHSGSELRRLVATGKLTPKEVQLLCANCHIIKTSEDKTQFTYHKKYGPVV